MTDLSGRSALVTGGFSGMGFAIATALAEAGANVAVGSYIAPPTTDRPDAAYYPGADEIERVSAQLSALGTKIHAAHLDVRDTEATEAFMADAAQAVGAIDILINAAGTTAEQPVVGHPDDLWDKIVDTNLTGAFRAIRAVLPGMIERKWGRIVSIGSTAASVGWRDNPAYCASKAGLLGLTRCVALEGAPHGVTCTMISPTWVETELMRRNVAQVVEREGKGRSAEDLMDEFRKANPQGRMMQPQEIAALAVFLCSDAAKGITMENIQITGGALW